MAKKPAAQKKAIAKKPKPKAPAAKRASKASSRAPSGLTWQQERFCLAYVECNNGARAAREAGYSEATARVQASRLLTILNIQRRIQELQRECAERLKISHDDLGARLWRTVTGDVNDLVQVRRIPCRYCHGIDHQYQWHTEREYLDAREAKLTSLAGDNSEALLALGAALEEGRTIPGMPTDEGGYGYDATKFPAYECPECNGEGKETVFTSDTRLALSHPLYDGVKRTKEGIEVKIADRGKALDQLARHLGFYNDKMELSASQELLEAARRINASSPPLDPGYMAKNAARLDQYGD